MHKILYLLNPSSNENMALKQWNKLRKCHSFLPEKPVNILEIDDLAAFLKEKNPDMVVIVGGDGTVNKVCQAILPLGKKPILAILPMGFGNALSYCLGVETEEKAIKVIRNPKEKLTIDLFKTTIPEVPIGVFTMGVGFDGQVVHTRMKQRYIGIRSYALAIIQSYFTHIERKMTLTVDNSITITGIASTLMIANAPTIGKNFISSEEAKLNDGLLDCTLFSSHYAYLTNLRLRGFKHPLYSGKNKVNFRAKHLKISGDQFAQVDGDPAIHVRPIEIEVLPKEVTFLRNSTEEIILPITPFI